MVRMTGEELFDNFSILLELFFQDNQQFNQALHEQALGAFNGSSDTPLTRFGEGRHPTFIGALAVQLVAMKKGLPFPGAGTSQDCRGGKTFQEFPGRRDGPIIKGFQGCRVVFGQRLLELID